MIVSQKDTAKKEEIRKVQLLANKLTPREAEILKYIIAGLLNKQIAAHLDIAEHTVKLQRHSISEKLGVKSVPEILRIAEKAGIMPFKNKYT
jgi:FixJ family two-component response regulator